jgi:hypothetical protein
MPFASAVPKPKNLSFFEFWHPANTGDLASVFSEDNQNDIARGNKPESQFLILPA